MEQGRASWTARRVAAQRLGFDREPAATGRPEEDRALHADVADGIDASDRGMGAYLQMRTRFVDRALVAALDDGVAQVLALGAGYDGRAWRYARPGVRFFELDHPDTQADKRDRLARLGIATDHVTFVPAEIGRDDVDDALARAGHDAALPTVITCEGLVAYLPRDVAADLFAALHRRAAPGSRLAVQVPLVLRDDRSRARRARLARAVGSVGEPLRTAIEPDDLPALLGGWHPVHVTDPHGTPLADTTSGVAFVQALRTGEQSCGS